MPTLHNCPVCTYRTVRQDTLGRHFRKMHGKKDDGNKSKNAVREKQIQFPDAKIIHTNDIPQEMIQDYAANLYGTVDQEKLSQILATPPVAVPKAELISVENRISAPPQLETGIHSLACQNESMIAAGSDITPLANTNLLPDTIYEKIKPPPTMYENISSPENSMDSTEIELLVANFSTQGSEVIGAEYNEGIINIPTENTNANNHMHPQPDMNFIDNNNNNEKQSTIIPTTSSQMDIGQIDIKNTVNPVHTSSPLQPNATISCAPTPLKGAVHAMASVRVALFDLSYAPQPGETFQVNGDGQLIKLQTCPGDLFQTDWQGFLQPIILPLPTVPVTSIATITTSTGQ
jgi:hypothetical protein